MLKIEKVQTMEDIKIFADFKIQLLRYHEEYALNLGIIDSEVNNYSYEDACRNIFNRESFILKLDNIAVGILQVEKQISEIDNNPILYVHSLYFSKQYRDKGFGVYVLKFLCKTYRLRIECSCWYNIPATKLYKKIGFKNLYTRFFLPFDNHFYDSDQN